MVALSFVQTAADVQQARRIMDDAGAAGVPLIAKLERPLALEHLEEILAACDAVMVARGDLGLEMPLERVPRAQKEITRARAPGRQAGDRRDAGARVDDDRGASDPRRGQRRRQRGRRRRRRDHARGRDRGRRLSGARGARRSTRSSATPRPRRCTAWPRSSGRPLTRITRGRCARPRSRSPIAARRRRSSPSPAAARTARWLSALRPHAPIIAATEREDTARRLTLYWGVVPLVHADRREPRRGEHAHRRAAGRARLRRRRRHRVFVSISADLTPPRRQLPQDPATLMPAIRYATVGAVGARLRSRGGRRARRARS